MRKKNSIQAGLGEYDGLDSWDHFGKEKAMSYNQKITACLRS